MLCICTCSSAILDIFLVTRFRVAGKEEDSRWLSGTYLLVHPASKHLGNARVRVKVLLELKPQSSGRASSKQWQVPQVSPTATRAAGHSPNAPALPVTVKQPAGHHTSGSCERRLLASVVQQQPEAGSDDRHDSSLGQIRAAPLADASRACSTMEAQAAHSSSPTQGLSSSPESAQSPGSSSSDLSPAAGQPGPFVGTATAITQVRICIVFFNQELHQPHDCSPFVGSVGPCASAASVCEFTVFVALQFDLKLCKGAAMSKATL